ncbi:MAG: MogA/MoaB family molybdenum cofactor biosynthesis protein [Anaerolineaceae bacterium]|jgi:molybdenum cofactor synthesis domain-containing protein|nr:MogA/MoaB family molybdenum cofactor biosynthesis protein [Anaerolineaceae bacterium]
MMMINNNCVSVLIVSDRSSTGERQDKSGPVILKRLEEFGYLIHEYKIVPDEKEQIIHALLQWSEEKVPLIFTSGGTGFAPRDITPEATLAIIERETPGISEYLRYKSFQITPHAALSRAVSGIKDQSLIINLPGSPKSVLECLDFLLPVLPHAIELILDDPGSENNH